MLLKAVFSSLSLSVLAASLALPSYAQETTPRTKVCAPVSEEKISSLFDRWNQSLATLDPVEVAANYSKSAVLLPTISNTPRTTPEKIKDYFVEFLQQRPQGVINERTITLGCNKASDVGIYTFTLHNENGEAIEASARYSYVYVYENGQWLIAHHHSSLMPEVAATSEVDIKEQYYSKPI
ncbi:SgcJ/EcaC family oxidoreductase [Spirulina subsalsa]|uniref:SgcJ/EcaC family oxidoreductase n=1 Tax=Spirulina subsalsa TaxID=54311 RepID=UPI0003104F6E|nr:SgcJ/EcaC family oxidoreductase [Spirulina subsalsa]